MKIRKWSTADKWLLRVMIVGGLIAFAGLLTACSRSSMDKWLPATRAHAAQVASDNAESAAEGNPISLLLTALGTAVSALAGAGIMLRRFDASPFEADDGTTLTEDELVHATKQSIASRAIPTVTGQSPGQEDGTNSTT